MFELMDSYSQSAVIKLIGIGGGGGFPMNDTWAVTVSGDTATWEELSPANQPSARYGFFYGFDDVMEAPAPDSTWFTEHIIVQGKNITIKVNDKTLVEYTEPDSVMQEAGSMGRFLDSGTFALQAHDPDSRVYYRNIMVKPLPD